MIVLNIKICPNINGIYIFNKVNIDESIISFLVNKYISYSNCYNYCMDSIYTITYRKEYSCTSLFIKYDLEYL